MKATHTVFILLKHFSQVYRTLVLDTPLPLIMAVV